MVGKTLMSRPNIFPSAVRRSRQLGLSHVRTPCPGRNLSSSSRFASSSLQRNRLPSISTWRGYYHWHSPNPKYSSSWTNYSTKSMSALIPPSSWDSHMHVVDPSLFPLSAEAKYTPSTHTLASANTYYTSLSDPLLNVVLVQPSIYGHDNSCLLDALQTLGPSRARGVVSFDPVTISIDELNEWHALGVRGVRLNLYSVGREMDKEELTKELERHAAKMKEAGLGQQWVLQLYIPLAMVSLLERIVPNLGVNVCIDHFGQPDLSKAEYAQRLDPYSLPGFPSLINLLKQGKTFVKMSAPYRISKRGDLSDLEPLAKEILRVAGKTSVVFATDWPHTRFEGVDIRPFIEKVVEWCDGDSEMIERVFRGNAEDLWAVGK